MGRLKQRPAVERFAEAMERKLRANNHKDGWDEMDLEDLILRAHQELDELEEALADEDCGAEDVVGEAVDVANFMMMVADNVIVRNALFILRGEREEECEQRDKAEYIRLKDKYAPNDEET